MAQVSRREQLIEGAIACLQTKGYARTTARDIAAASSANLASIGYHFGSKESLLNEALMRILEERNRRVALSTSSAEVVSPLDRLTATNVAVRKMFRRYRPVLVAFVEAMAQAERSPDSDWTENWPASATTLTVSVTAPTSSTKLPALSRSAALNITSRFSSFLNPCFSTAMV